MSDSQTGSAKPNLTKPALSGNLKGALLLVMSGIGFTVYLLMNKLMSADVHPVLLAFWRAIFATLFSLPFIVRSGFGVLKTRRPGLLLVRSLFGTLGFTLAIVAVSDFFTVTLAQFNAISFTRPLFVTLLAALILREQVGLHRWGAVLVGFVGVLIMVMPGLFTFWRPGALESMNLDLGSFVALGSAFSLAAAIILVKFLTGELSSMALLFYANILSSVLLAPFLFLYWDTFSLGMWGLIIAMSGVGFISQFCYIAAMSAGEASFISPIDYLRMPMSAVADFAVFRLIPGLNIWIGAAIIVVSTLYVGLRERRIGKR